MYEITKTTIVEKYSMFNTNNIMLFMRFVNNNLAKLENVQNGRP